MNNPARKPDSLLPVRTSLRQRLQNRHRRFSRTHPKIGWKRWLCGTLALASATTFLFDRPAIEWVRSEPDWLRRLAATLTDLGKSDWILISAAVAGLGLHMLGKRFSGRAARLKATEVVHASLFVFLSVAGSGLIANLLKRMIGRARPTLFETLGNLHFQPFANDYNFESFPSGHSTTDGALAMALALLFPPLRLPLLLLGFLLAATRTLVGAHYPSDVVTGYSFGVWFSLMVAILFARHGLLFRTGTPGWPKR